MSSATKRKVHATIFTITAILAVLFLIVAIYFYNASRHPGKEINSNSSELVEKYDYLNKTKILDLKKHYIIDFSDLKKQFLAVKEKYSAQPYIYFAYLNNGSWVGLGERDEFAAASLVKVPLAMSVFKAVESERLSLEQTYTLSDLDLNNDFGNLYKVGPDSRFTVIDLVKIMLRQSDNTARNAIYSIFQKIGIDDPLEDVYGDLGWEILPPVMSDGQMSDTNYNKINLKVLSNMFLALYNATYINLDNSQQVLDYLAHTSFDDKIRAGVPEEVDVAHKIGTAGNDNTFSDCGIIYAPNRHYLLCVGMSGADEKTAAKFMKEISEVAYDFVIHN